MNENLTCFICSKDLSDNKENCDYCLEIENIALYIVEKANHRGWENAEYMAADKFGEEKVLKAIEFLDRNDAISQGLL